MIIGYIGDLTVVATVDSFTDEDTKTFESHWRSWLKKVNEDKKDVNMSYHHLLDLTFHNSLALNESSSTITQKWTALFQKEEGWKFLFDSSPFPLTVTKVSPNINDFLIYVMKYLPK